MTTQTNQPATPPSGLSAERQAERQKLTEAVRAQYQHELNIPYGSHAKQILDIYRPKQTTAAPVLVFLHGGGFRQGSPGPQGFVGASVLAHGGMFVSIGYRLIPDAPFPDSCDDVELGLRWLQGHIVEHGGDSARIFLSGHSAGASLAASVALRPWFRETALPADLIKGMAVFSGFYDRSEPSADHNLKSDRYVQRLTGAIERLPSLSIVVSADNDFPDAPENADAIVAAIKAKGGSVEQFLETDADHFAATKGLADDSGAVSQAVRRMMRLS